MQQGGLFVQALCRLPLESLSQPSSRRYRVAHKPVYQVKQKVLASVAWRCCPGFVGPDCQHHGRVPCDPPSPLTSDPRGHAAPLTSGVNI